MASFKFLVESLSLYLLMLIVMVSRIAQTRKIPPIIQQNTQPVEANEIRRFKRQTLSQQYFDLRGDGNLMNDQNPQILDKCCACDEAKYELVFEGLWSRHTHPDNFPSNYWLAHFSDVIGASHANDFRMWEENQYASDGVKELAQTGSTKKLESELKLVSSKIRTIIKARELQYPLLNSRTFAVFRTDRHHHLVSMLSKLGPSPDWMVGISGLELCQADCTWSLQKVVNLYLYDAGIDSNDNSTSSSTSNSERPRQAQEYSSPVRRFVYENKYKIVSPVQNKHLSLALQPGDNFNQYSNNNTNKPITQNPIVYSSKPFARLIITRQRIYEKACNEQDNAYVPNSTLIQNSSPSMSNSKQFDSETISEYPATVQTFADCRFTDWSDWSSCSSTCGKGIRTRIRSFINDNAYTSGCSRSDLIEKETCVSECIGNTICVTRDWSDWSECSVSCGSGYKQRTRSFIGQIKKTCTSSVELVEREVCTGNFGAECSDDELAKSSDIGDAVNCQLTDWSPWTECSVMCGKGTKIRTRQYRSRESYKACSARLTQKAPCTGKHKPDVCANLAKESCSKPVDFGPCRNSVERWYYDKDRNICNKFQYGGCFGNKNNFERYQDCERLCILTKQSNNATANDPIDCVMSGWGVWSACNANCKRTRHRKIIQRPKNGGKPCEKLIKTQRCNKDNPQCRQNQTSNSSNQKTKGSNTEGRNVASNVSNSAKNQTIIPPATSYSSSMNDDDEDGKFSRLQSGENYNNPLNNIYSPLPYIAIRRRGSSAR